MTQIPAAYRLRAVAGIFFRRSITRSRGQFLNLARTSCRETQRALLDGSAATESVIGILARLRSDGTHNTAGVSSASSGRRLRTHSQLRRSGCEWKSCGTAGGVEQAADVRHDKRHNGCVETDSRHDSFSERLSTRLAILGNGNLF